MDKQLSIRDASRFIIGAAIIREMAMAKSPGATLGIDEIAAASLRQDEDGAGLRTSILKLADKEAHWFRSTLSHVLATERVVETREQELGVLNNINLAALTALEFGPQAAAGDVAANTALHSAGAIGGIPGSPTPPSGMLQSLNGIKCTRMSLGASFMRITRYW